MKFKERLWQLFLMIVLGVTLSVCDAGDSDDNFDSNLLSAGSAIAADVTTGSNWVRFGNFQIVEGSFSRSALNYEHNFEKSFNSNMVLISLVCLVEYQGDLSYRDTSPRLRKLESSFKVNEYLDSSSCPVGSTINFQINGKYQ